MGVNYFTDEQVEYLRKNKYVKHVSNKGITYTLEFKELFIDQYGKKRVYQIFEEAGLPKSILGKKELIKLHIVGEKSLKRNPLL